MRRRDGRARREGLPAVDEDRGGDGKKRALAARDRGVDGASAGGGYYHSQVGPDVGGEEAVRGGRCGREGAVGGLGAGDTDAGGG